MATRSELIDLAVSEGLDPEEADELTDEELADMYGEPMPLGDPEEFALVQDQGSFDEPVKEEVYEEPSDLGTEELQTRARQIVEGVNRPRDRFPWEVPPPRRKK